jgi:soluble P-type ATPase
LKVLSDADAMSIGQNSKPRGRDAVLYEDVPGFGRIEVSYLVSDFNGVLARDGILIRGVANRVKRLSRFLDIRVLTFDTFGTAASQLRRLPCTVTVLSGNREAEQKRDYLTSLGLDRVIAIGNGANDQLMLKAARVGIAVIGPEGATVDTVAAADIVVGDILAGLELLLDNRRFVATLRR